MKSPYGEGLTISQVWCDVLNLLVGILCITNGFRVRLRSYSYTKYGEQGIFSESHPHPNKEMLIFTGKKKQIINLKSMR